jgi:glucokinase
MKEYSANKEIIGRWLDYLSVGIDNLIKITGAENIVIGGGISESFAIFGGDLLNKIKNLRYSNKIGINLLPAKLGNKAGIIGAAM